MRTNESNVKMFVYSVVSKIYSYILHPVRCTVDVLGFEQNPGFDLIVLIEASMVSSSRLNVVV